MTTPAPGGGVRAAFLGALVLALAVCAAVARVHAQEPRRVVIAEYDGIIHPIAAEFLTETLERAASIQAEAAIFVLRTPGGLLESTRQMTSEILASDVPVVVYVGPRGGRAASAGFLILLAADVAAMAPGTHAGAAHPVAAGGQQQEPTDPAVMEKATEDTAAYARTLAGMRGRNAQLAAEAVTESRAFTEREALEARPPLIDLVADDVEALLLQLDGRTVIRASGAKVSLATAGASVDTMTMTWRQRLLGAIAHPQVALMLLSLGMLGLMVELWNPGAVVPGVAGSLSLVLGLFAFQVLPVSTAGFLLIGLGILLIVFELLVPSFGVLGVGGAIALFFGSVMITREVPGVEVSYGVLVPVVVAFTGIALFLGRLALRAHRTTSTSGAEGFIGERGVTLSAIGSGRPGQVQTHGEIWRAVSEADIAPGTPVRVTAIDGLTIHVEPLPAASTQGEFR